MEKYSKDRWQKLAGILTESDSPERESVDYSNLDELGQWYEELIEEYGGWDQAFSHGRIPVEKVVNRMKSVDPIYLLGFIRHHGTQTVMEYLQNLI